MKRILSLLLVAIFAFGCFAMSASAATSYNTRGTSYIVLKAITEEEGIQYTANDWKKTLERLTKETDLTEDEILEHYGTFGICYEMMYHDVKSILSLYIKVLQQ